MRKARLLSLFAFGGLAVTLICMIGILVGQANEQTDGSVSAKASPFTILDPFDPANGANPSGSLTLSGTTLYGVTNMGGDNDKGTIFKFDTEKNVKTVLHSLSGGTNEGAYPSGTLTL